MRLFFIFPISGPNNGVKIISSHIRNAFLLENEIELKTIDTAQASGYDNFGKFSFNKLASFFKILKQLFRIKKSDVVYLNFTPKGFAFYRDLIILMICHFRASNVTIHMHANGLENKIKSYNKWLFSKTKIIVINNVQEEKLKNFSKSCCLIPNALPDYYNSTTLNPKHNDDINFIFLSNISKEKGVYRLQKLAKDINKLAIPCKINVYGGTLSEKDESLIKKLNDDYKFLTYYGAIENEKDKFEALQQNDALLFLSDENYEVSPLVYIEALMSGLMVFSTKQVVVENLLDKNVAKIFNKDLNNFEKLVYEFSSNKENQKTIARNTYLNTYSFPKYIRELKNYILNDQRK